jgi:hypothetical protein
MLPILRLIPVGGVLLAIAIVLLALNPPRATSRAVPGELMAARGPLMNRNDHPEWRQFLILAALRRAGELKRLRDLHDTVVHQAPPAVATAPDRQAAADADVAAPASDKAPQADAKPEGKTVVKTVTKTAAVAATAPAEAPPEVTKAETAGRETAAPKPLADAAKPVSAAPKLAATTPLAAAGPAPAEAASKPVAEVPAVAEANPFEATPAEATSIEPIAKAPIETTPAHAKPIAVAPDAIAPAPIAAKPVDDVRMASIAPAAEPPVVALPAPPAKLEAKPETKPEAKPEATPIAAAPPAPEKADPTATRETTGSRIGTDLPPAVPPAPEAAKVAALITERADRQSGDITGSIDQSPGHGTTIPLGIGEASSTEIEVFMPRERPPVLRELDLRRANQSRLEPRRRKARRHAHVRRKKTDTAQQQDNFFAFLFRPIDGNSAYKPVKLNLYQPPQYRSGEVIQ